MSPDATLEDYFSFAPLHERISKPVRDSFFALLKNNTAKTPVLNSKSDQLLQKNEIYSIDGPLASEVTVIKRKKFLYVNYDALFFCFQLKCFCYQVMY